MDAMLLAQTRRAIRALLAVPAARAPGLKAVRDLDASGAAGSLRARYYEPADPIDAPLILYLHGGGLVLCDIDTHDSICSWLAQSSGARLVSVGYRLAPETRFPGQVEDARAACSWALRVAPTLGAQPGKLVLAGDSAGAYLAALCALELNQQAPGTAPLQVLLYALVHFKDSLWAEEELRNFRLLGRLAVLYMAAKLGAEDYPSLLDLDLSAAPTTILAGGGPLDPVRADVKSLSAALKSRSVRVIEKKYPALLHGGLNFTAYSKTAVAALREVGALVRSELVG